MNGSTQPAPVEVPTSSALSQTESARPVPAPWGEGRGPLSFQLGLSTFGLLALELALIRWTGGQIRLIAYFSNLVLVVAFLGMGLGVTVGRDRPEWVHRLLPALAILSAILCFSGPLGLMHLRLPDPTIALWGGETTMNLPEFVRVVGILMGCFAMIGAVFVLAGIPVGWLFGQLPPLKAYTVDLTGSLLGVVATSALSATGCGPGVWLLLGSLPFIYLSRRPVSVVAGIVVVALGFVSGSGARFSAYNRIDLSHPANAPDAWEVATNRDYHQYILDLSDQYLASHPTDETTRFRREVYDLPWAVKRGGGRGLVVGAGTGNDVAAALRNGFAQVVSVDIDPEIVQIGRELHPAHPYDDPRVVPAINDARAWFSRNPDERFDVVCYGLLDSHAMFSAMSTLRLDNYVYTLEGLRQGWQHVKEDGEMSVSFSVAAGNWMLTRLRLLVREATGLEPIIVPHGYNQAATLLVGRHLDASRIGADLNQFDFDATTPGVRIPTDDWPYLYLRPDTFPVAYVVVLVLVLLGAGLAIRRVHGPELFQPGHFELALFFMGAAFMLLETRLVTELSLLFGSTWIVNSSVFAGVLLLVMAANQLVLRRPPASLLPWYALLVVSLVATNMISPSVLNALPVVGRGVVAGALFGLPVGFAGVIFSTLLREAPNPASALGSNLVGSVLGGCLEYLSMYLGLRATGWLALAFYLVSFLVTRPRREAPVLLEPAT